MLSLLPIWAVLFCTLVGWGLTVIWLLRRLGGRDVGGALGLFQVAWLGYAGLIASLQLVSLLLPIAEVVLGLSFAPAIAGFVLQRRALARWARVMRVRDRRVVIVIACVVMLTALVVSWTSCNNVLWYDTGLYHLGAVKWFATYPVVPGLANLHLRFGYNNSVHLFGAYVDTYWQGVAAHAMNGFLMTMLLAQWFIEILTARGPRGRLRQVFCMLTLPFLLAKLWTIEMASLSTDLSLAIVCFTLVLELVSLQTDARERTRLPLALVLSLGAVAVSTKLGGLPYFVITAVLAAYLLRGVRWRIRVLLFTLPALIVVGWVLRGVILSGWLLFPLFGRLPLSWSVRHKVAHDHLLEIQSWGRIFGKGPEQVFAHGFWGWFPQWFETFRASREIALFIAASAALVWRLAGRSLRYAERRSAYVAAVVTCALGIAQWFTGAPDLRYGSFLFWLTAATVLSPMLARAMLDEAQRVFVLVMSVALCYWSGGLGVQLGVKPPLFARPVDPPRATLVEQQAGPSTTVLFPTSSDQCWDERLPCTPAPGKQVLRRPGALQSGYLPSPRKAR